MVVSATIGMIVFTSGNTLQRFVVTLNEKKTLSSCYFLFVFTHVTTKQVVNWIVQDIGDLSGNETRYNEFIMDVSTVFSGQKSGQWSYEVYEQVSSTNTVVTGLNMLENGKMLLKADPSFGFAGYDVKTQYSGYGG